jgi:hypothetical protein
MNEETCGMVERAELKIKVELDYMDSCLAEFDWRVTRVKTLPKEFFESTRRAWEVHEKFYMAHRPVCYELGMPCVDCRKVASGLLGEDFQ